MKDLLKNPGLS